jgi:hypothetical protein
MQRTLFHGDGFNDSEIRKLMKITHFNRVQPVQKIMLQQMIQSLFLST